MSRRTSAPQSLQRVGVIGVGLVEGLVLRGGLGEFLVLSELGDQGQPQVAARGGELDGFLVPGVGLGGASHAGQGAAQPDQGLDVLGFFLGPLFVVGDQAGLVVVSEEDFLDFAPDFAMEPAIGPELAEHGLEVVEGVLPIVPSRTFKSAACMASWTWRKGSVGLFGESLEARQSGGGLVLLGEGLGDLLLDARVAGKEGFEPVPDLEGLVVFLGALVDAAESLEDFEEVVAGGFSRRGRVRRPRRRFRAGRPGRGPGRDRRRAGDRRAECVSAFLSAATAAASWPRWNSRRPRISQAVPSSGFLSTRSRYDLMKASSEPRSTW